MAYLKALGIFRLVSEQRDDSARAWWQNGSFLLRSSLDKDEAVKFFLEEYKPTPIVAPWNGGSGFYSKDKSKAMDTILGSDSPRFQIWNDVVAIGKDIVSRGEGTDKKFKEWVLARCRAEFPDSALAWLDAAFVITKSGAKYPPLLGTGGNDGRLEFSNNFMQNLVAALNIAQQPNGASVARSRLVAALFNEGSPEFMKKRSTGFFNPGGVGGANSSVGFKDDALTNPWDYVLMFEGVLLFAGAAARRLSSEASPKAVFPFTVDSSASGYGTSADSEYGNSSRAEFWAPLWRQPAKLQELGHVVSEGRAQVGRRQGAHGTDFARAVVGLGTELGVSQFQRYGFMMRNGKAYLAIPIGRFHTPGGEIAARSTKLANVLFDLDNWLGSLRRHVSGGKAPAGIGPVLRRIDSAIITLCQRGLPCDVQNVLIAVGGAERWLASSGLREHVSPLDALSSEWLDRADDDSAEFRLARAIASIHQKHGKSIGPIRRNLEPVNASQQRLEWAEKSASFVWTAGDPLANMLAVLGRRCLERRMAGMQEEGGTHLNAAYPARPSDIAKFLEGGVDIHRMSDLALPLSFVHYQPLHGCDGDSRRPKTTITPYGLPVAYAVMKLTLLPSNFVCRDFGTDDEGMRIAMEPSMLAMLRSGRVSGAYRVACRRLRVSGLTPLSETPGIQDRSDQGRRLAAALLFPLDEGAYCSLAECALRKPSRIETE